MNDIILSKNDLSRLDENPVTVYLATLGKSTRRPTLNCLVNIAAMITGIDDKETNEQQAFNLPWFNLRFQHTALIRSELQTKFTLGTVNRHLSALRGILKSCWRLGLINTDEYMKASDIENVKGSTLPAGRNISSGELSGLMTVCNNDNRKIGYRDSAIIAVLYSCGLRRQELVNLNIADYSQETGELKILAAKGKKDRTAYVTNGAKEALDDWLKIRGIEDGPIFLPIRKADKIVFSRMTTQAVLHILQTRADEAGIKELSPHDMRRTFISDLLENGTDVLTVQKLAGHSDPKTTSRYDRRDEKSKQQAVSKLFVPYSRKK